MSGRRRAGGRPAGGGGDGEHRSHINHPMPAACSIKFGLPRDGDLQQLAQQIVSACRLLHAQRVPEVERLLAQAREQQQRQGEQEQAHLPHGPAASLEMPQRYNDLDRQLLQQQQQQYLADASASATQALSAAAATACLERLDEYLVGGGPAGAWLHTLAALLSCALAWWLPLTAHCTGQPCITASYTPCCILHTRLHTARCHRCRLCCRRLCMKTTLESKPQL